MRTERATLKLTVILAVNLLLPSLAFAQNPASEDYAARARTLIEADLKKLPPPNEFRIEFIGDPNGLLDHARFHGGTPRPLAGRASLSGRVVKPSWEAVAGLRLSLLSSNDAGAPRSAVTSANGEFRFPDLPQGDYQLRLGDSSSFDNVTLEAGNTRILVRSGSTKGVIFTMGRRERLRPIVLANVYQASRLHFSYQVDFHKAPPNLLRIDLTEINDDFKDFGSLSLPTEAEAKQLRTELTPLLTALMDVGKGPDRLKPFFSSQLVCRIYDNGEPAKPVRHNQGCAIYLLDMISLAMWFQMESPDGDPPPMGTPRREVPSTTDEELIKLNARALDVFRQELRSAGLFEPQHAARVQQYFVDLLSNVGITKLNSTGEAPEFPLPKGELFMLGRDFPLLLIREGARLKIVGILIGFVRYSRPKNFRMR